MKILEKKYIGNNLYLKIKKDNDIAASICGFFSLLEIGDAVLEFDREYEDVIDETIIYSDKNYSISVIGTKDSIHMIINYEESLRKKLDAALHKCVKL